MLLMGLVTALLLPLTVLCFLTIAGIPLGIVLGGGPMGVCMQRRHAHMVCWDEREQAMTTYDEEGNEVKVPWKI